MSLSTYSRRLFISTLFAASAGTLLPAFATDFKSERISISAEGQGKDVVLIHGLGSSPRVWRELVKAVPGYRYHLVQIHGFAGHARGSNSDGAVAAPVAEEIARYIAASKLDKPAVIGHSMGGSIGIMLTGRNPGAVSKLMVVDMMPFLGAMFGGPNATPDSVKPMADALKAQMLNPDQAARQARTTATIDGMVNTVAMRAGALEDSLKSDQDVVARGFHELVVTDLRAELEKITVPATVLYVTPKGAGMTDERIDAAYKASYAPLKGVTLKRIASSAHFIMWDQSEQFQAEVKGFLAK
jgi:pimeloyl-ACP methyl ester carboxylesterase